jgi:hypothetical protein
MALVMISCRDKIAAEEKSVTIAQFGRGGGESNNTTLPSRYCPIAGPVAAESGGCDGQL